MRRSDPDAAVRRRLANAVTHVLQANRLDRVGARRTHVRASPRRSACEVLGWSPRLPIDARPRPPRRREIAGAYRGGDVVTINRSLSRLAGAERRAAARAHETSV